MYKFENVVLVCFSKRLIETVLVLGCVLPGQNEKFERAQFCNFQTVQ
jgi:hypothetical protein